jgi:hypothetical protein
MLTTIGLAVGGRSAVHIYTQTIHRTIKKRTIHRTAQQFRKSAGRAPSWLVILWHLPYNRGKSSEKPQSVRLEGKHNKPHTDSALGIPHPIRRGDDS